MARKVIGYKVEVEIHPGESRVRPLTDEERASEAAKLAHQLIGEMTRHLDNVDPRYKMSWQDYYVTDIVPVYEDDGEEE